MKKKFFAAAVKAAVRLPLAVALAGVGAGAASATVLNFSYSYADGHILTGSLSGTDAGNYFTVTGVETLAVNGVSQGAILPSASVYSADSFLSLGHGHNGDNTPVVTLDGSYMDLIFTDSTGNNGFDFYVADVASAKNGNYSAYSLPAGFDEAKPYLQPSYHASLAVPETATWMMMLVGMGAIGLALRRRATVGVTYA